MSNSYAISSLSELLPSFHCPLTMDEMDDPCVLITGQTYDRCAITEWLRLNDTCPLTGTILNGNHSLVPNISLKKSIEEWKDKIQQTVRHLNLTVLNDESSHNTQGSIPFKSISIESLIVSGRTKNIYKGELFGKSVAVLVSKGPPVLGPDKESDLLSVLRHPNIVRFIGRSKNEKGQGVIVLELCPGGITLRNLVSEIDDAVGERMSFIVILTILNQIVDGMEELQANRVIHRDLAARNILVFSFDGQFPERIRIKISDFGMSSTLEDSFASYYYSCGQGVETPVRWMAPEALSKNKWSEKSDVYSFGVLMWEILSGGQVPWGLAVSEREVQSLVLKGELLPLSEEWPTEFLDLMKKCWRFTARDRPNFSDIKGFLTRLLIKPIQSQSIQLQCLKSSDGTLSDIVRPLNSLSVEEVGSLLIALNLSDCVRNFAENFVRGDELQFVSSPAELFTLVSPFSIVKAKKLVARLAQYRDEGVPLCLLESCTLDMHNSTLPVSASPSKSADIPSANAMCVSGMSGDSMPSSVLESVASDSRSNEEDDLTYIGRGKIEIESKNKELRDTESREMNNSCSLSKAVWATVRSSPPAEIDVIIGQVSITVGVDNREIENQEYQYDAVPDTLPDSQHNHPVGQAHDFSQSIQLLSQEYMHYPVSNEEKKASTVDQQASTVVGSNECSTGCVSQTSRDSASYENPVEGIVAAWVGATEDIQTPNMWVEKYSSRYQRRYWMHTSTKVKSWKDPSIAAVLPSSSISNSISSCSSSPATACGVWIEKYSKKHSRNYWISSNGKKSWIPPKTDQHSMPTSIT